MHGRSCSADGVASRPLIGIKLPSLHFKGKALVENLHLAVPYHGLAAARSIGMSREPSLDDNLIVHGDNLKALKALLPTYHGRVKCIYIDPPYNLGSEGWAYNDSVNSPMMREWLGKVVDADDLTRHDKWCCMMLPRLKLLRELLRADGTIFVSIDDNEVHRLRLLMDEVFGEENFVGSFVWEGTGKNDARFISVGHDYVLCYARRMESLSTNGNRWRVFKEGTEQIQRKAAEFVKKHSGDFRAASDDLKAWFASLDKKHKAWAHRHYNRVDAKGVYFAGDISWPGGGGPTYEVIHPETNKPAKVPARGWVFPTEDGMSRAIAQQRVHFGDDETRVPNLKRYLHETDQQVLTSVFYQDRRAAHQGLVRVLPDMQFEYPKDERVLRRLFEAVTSDDDIIVDSFAGSGTTAHAVLALNKQDGGNRRFLLIECEDYAERVTAERVRRVIKGVPDSKDAQVRAGLGGTFSYFTLGESIQREALLDSEKLPSWEKLASYLFFTATGEPFEPSKTKQKQWLAGEGRAVDVYLLYTENIEELKDMALTKSIAKELSVDGRSKVVFAPTKYVDADYLRQNRIAFQQLPFEIYERIDLAQ